MGRSAAEKPCEVCDRFGRYGRFLFSRGPDTMTSVRRPRLSLASQILVFQLAIVLGALLIGAIASYVNESRQLDQRYEKRSLNIAKSVAGMPSVGDGLRDSDPSRTLQPLAEGIRKASGASFVVIAGANGIRYSHPRPVMIGKPIDEDFHTVLAGKTWIGVEHGTLGVSARGKAPIFDGQNRVIGIVSVGFLEATLSQQLAAMLPQLALYMLVALALGVVGSIFLARRLKRQTFGLEPGEIATLLETREASLHGIREGAVATDVEGRITLLNDEARRLLRVSSDSVGRRLTDVLPPGRVRDLLIGEATGADEVVLAADRVLVVSRMPVVVRGRTIGHIATFRDRTELESLLRELDNARSVSEALRAQAHDFSNRLHTIAGLIELGRQEEAIQLTTESSSVSQELTESLLERVGDPVLGALLLGKSAVAAERGIQFRLSPDSRLDGDAGHPRDLITVVGNLIDNALDAAATSLNGGPRWVEVSIRQEHGDVLIQVHDSGPGIGLGETDRIFSEGYTTKVASPGSRRGLGLALVKQVAARRGGEVTVLNQGGALFTVRLPLTAKPVPVGTA
jgi:two-component system CitB family sensor kinase